MPTDLPFQTMIAACKNQRETGNEAYNNLFYNCTANFNFSLFPTHNYNHFVDSGSTRSEANGTSGTGNPFVSLDALNFRLSSDTAAGVVLGSPYDTDMYGTARTGTRGAIQFVAAEPAPPAVAQAYIINATAVNVIIGCAP